MNTLWGWWTGLHFLRPYWLVALLLLPALAFVPVWRKRQEHWQQAVDPHLLAHLLESGARHGAMAHLAKCLAFVLAILALAGPSWRQIEQPLLEPQAAPLVIALDLSGEIITPDLPPSRLVQVRAKLKRLLEQREGGEVALIVYANDAFTVTPLTDDGANIILFLDALAPDIMPQDGQRADHALQWAQNLLQQSGATQGDILLLTAQADSRARRQAADTHKAGFRVSVLALGTEQGAAYRNRGGRILHSQRDSSALKALASAGGGHYQTLTANDADLNALGLLQPSAHLTAGQEATSRRVPLWEDQGYWLLLPLLLLVLPAFRQLSRRIALVLVCLFFPWTAELHAAETGSLWQRPDQIEHQQLEEGVHAYREGAYSKAQRLFSGSHSADAWYNQGNALARQGRYQQAIDAYDRALELQPDMEDAIANRAIVEAARQQQQQAQQNAQNKDESDSSAEDGEADSSSAPSDSPQDDASSRQPSDDQSEDASSSPAQDAQSSSENSQSSHGEESQSAPTQENSSSSAEQDQGQEGNKSESKEPGLPNNTGSPHSNDVAENQALDAEDSTAQQQADAALQEQMAQALQQAQQGHSNQSGSAQNSSTPLDPQQQHQLEQQQALDAWLQRIPDDPGALLRAKFHIEQQRRRREGR